jgi:hypothetical protein
VNQSTTVKTSLYNNKKINLLKDNPIESKKTLFNMSWYWKVRDCYCLIALVKDEESEGQGDTSESLLRQSAT